VRGEKDDPGGRRQAENGSTEERAERGWGEGDGIDRWDVDTKKN